MRPLSLAFEHFGPYRERQHIDFTELDDFFLIYGKTGSGKTTIFDAIAFALYGQALGGRSSLERELVSKFSPQGSKPWVEFEFMASDARWKVYRSLPYKKVNRKGVESEAGSEITLTRFRDSGESELVTDRLAEANSILLKLLKLRADEFSKIVLLPQGEFQEFLEMKTTERVEILQKLFDVEIYDRIAEKAHQQAIELDSSLKMQREEMERLSVELGENAEQRVEREETEARNIDEQISRANAELSQLATEIDRIQDKLALWEEISSAWNTFEEIERSRHEFELRAARLEAVRSLSDIANEGQRLIDIYAEAVAIANKVIESGRMLVAIEKERNEIEGEERRLPQVQRERDELQRNSALLQRAVEAWSAKEALEQDRVEIARKLETMGAEVAAREAEIAGLKKEIGALESAIEEEPDSQEEFRRKLSARESLARIAELLAQIDKVEADRAKILRKISATEDSLAILEAETAASERLRESMEDQARHAVVSSLASTLVEGQPCPVCGSITHPQPAPLFPNAPDERALRQARDDVEAKKSKRAALLQQIESDRERVQAFELERQEKSEKLSSEWRKYAEFSGDSTTEPAAGLWHSTLEKAQTSLDAELRALKAKIEGFAEARALLAKRRFLASQRENDFSALIRQKSELDIARAENEANLFSLAQSAGSDDPHPQLLAARQRLAAIETEIERNQQRVQRWHVAQSTISSELDIHAHSLASKLEALEIHFDRFLKEVQHLEVEHLLSLVGISEDTAEGAAGMSFQSRSASNNISGDRGSLIFMLDELASLLPRAFLSDHQRSLSSLLSSFATTESDALELARRVTGSVWPQARIHKEAQEIERFKESWTKARAAYSTLETRALSMGAAPRTYAPHMEAPPTEKTLRSSTSAPCVFDFEAETRALSEARSALEIRLAEVRASMEQLGNQRAALSATIAHTRSLMARREELSRSYDAAADEFGKRDMLDRLLSGSLNPRRKMPFKNFVLSQQFKEIAARASERLYRMSGGRYIVQADYLSGGGNKKIGLELSVFDAWNGGSRPVGTLSGGEKFMLSISLALGLADSIQERAGANRIESLFIDEGFGSLDEESLSLAISVLDELRGDKKIAIISHVEELCNRIPSRIVVKKGVGGSRLECERG